MKKILISMVLVSASFAADYADLPDLYPEAKKDGWTKTVICGETPLKYVEASVREPVAERYSYRVDTDWEVQYVYGLSFWDTHSLYINCFSNQLALKCIEIKAKKGGVSFFVKKKGLKQQGRQIHKEYLKKFIPKLVKHYCIPEEVVDRVYYWVPTLESVMNTVKRPPAKMTGQNIFPNLPSEEDMEKGFSYIVPPKKDLYLS